MPTFNAAPPRPRLLPLALGLGCALLLAACASSDPTKREVKSEGFEPAQLLQSDANRFANLTMRDNLESLETLLEKLYRRNPGMWRKTGAATLDDARDKVMQAIREQQPLPGLGEERSVDAMYRALTPAFDGDRAGALVYGMGSMLVEAHGGHVSVTLVNGLDAQKLANAAQNMMIAAWLLAERKGRDGQPLLLSNEISPAGRNLSFEREMGKIIGRLDTLAATIDEKYRRSVIGYVQGLAAGPFMQFIPIETATAMVK